METNGNFQDPYCRKEFWINQFCTKSKNELEESIREFTHFSTQLEAEYRLVMSVSRADVCKQVLEELLREKNSVYKNKNQGDLFAG